MSRYIVDPSGVVVFLDKPRSARKPKNSAQSSKREQPTAKCSVCHCYVKPSRLNKHLANVHSVPVPDHGEIISQPTIRQSNISHVGDQTRAGRSTSTTNDASTTAGDPRDGGKYLGHIAREGGRFGSLPQFDDYGDESGPD